MSEATTHYSSYDPLARIYNEDWAIAILKETLSPIEKLLLPHLPEGAHILDLGCGAGQLAQQLLEKGYKITGIDGSKGMLNYARQNAPGGQFILGNACSFEYPLTFHRVISIGVLNHIMKIEELKKVFHNVYEALLENGLFLFYIYLEEEYQYKWNGKMSGNVKDDYAWADRNSYCPEDKVGRINLTVFQWVEETWQRSDTTIIEKCYSTSDIQSALSKAGFTDVSIYDAERDLAIPERAGSTYFVCRKRLG